MPTPLPTAPDARLPSRPDPESAVMERNGIIRVAAFQYHVDGYRYGNLADALAQVTRRARAERLDG
ncbi:hypothetical protein [Sphingosinicella terrae]|uniref:hypothetical protein n=1 Tax=Sphingosinicella terrae TaxID=2172047 RepID=UPI0013B36155|nr:hypothetical protein [Sphingosinicella terrae]